MIFKVLSGRVRALVRACHVRHGHRARHDQAEVVRVGLRSQAASEDYGFSIDKESGA